MTTEGFKMGKIEFTVYGSPVPQGRPRFARVGNFVRTYDPASSKSWKETVKWQAIENKAVFMDGALWMSLCFKLPRPRSLAKKVKHHTKKPDLDNLVKGVKDGLKGICYRDDSQVVQMTVSKEYSEQPGVIIKIGQVEVAP